MRTDCSCDDLPDGAPVDQHVMIRTYPHRLGQCDLDPVGYT